MSTRYAVWCFVSKIHIYSHICIYEWYTDTQQNVEFFMFTVWYIYICTYSIYTYILIHLILFSSHPPTTFQQSLIKKRPAIYHLSEVCEVLVQQRRWHGWYIRQNTSSSRTLVGCFFLRHGSFVGLSLVELQTWVSVNRVVFHLKF